MWSIRRAVLIIGISIGLFFLAGLAVGGGLLDPDTSVTFGLPNIGFVFEKSASASSPFAKCKQRQSALEAIITGKTTALSRVSNEISQLQKKAADTDMQFTKEGIVRVPNAELVNNCERAHAPSSIFAYTNDPSPSPSPSAPRTHCSSLLADQIRDVEEKKREYSELQKAEAQTSAELDQLQQECFGPKK